MHKTKWLVTIVAAVVALSGAVALGVQQYHRKQRLEAFQKLVRVGMAQADVALSLKFDLKSSRESDIERFIDGQKELMVKVSAADMPDNPELQHQYVELLRAQIDLMSKTVAASSFEVAALRRDINRLSRQFQGEDSAFKESCEDMREVRNHTAGVNSQLRAVISLERDLQSACSNEHLSCDSVFAKYEKKLAKRYDLAFEEQRLRQPFCKEGGGPY